VGDRVAHRLPHGGIGQHARRAQGHHGDQCGVEYVHGRSVLLGKPFTPEQLRRKVREILDL
jgi:hypothetical protein